MVMRFTCSIIPVCKWQCASGKILVTILVFITVSSVSFPSKGGHECPNCSGQYVKTIDPSTGKCVACWPCPKCLDGRGLSVPCGSAVNVFTKIHCVLCVHGVNFSDSAGTGQCQPCGVCAGKHERVLQKCTLESDVKCDCKVGFYRNKTTNKCLPCGSCSSCSNDDEIISKCQEDTSENSQHQKPLSSSYGTSLLTVVDIYSSAVVKPSRSTVLATSSSPVTSSYHHAIITPKLVPGSTKMVPVPSRTQQIKATATSTSFLESSKYDPETPTQSKPPLQVIYQKTHKLVHTNILISVLTIVCVFIWICTFCVLKKLRRDRLINDPRNWIVLSKIKQNEQVDPVTCKSSGLNEPMANSCGKEDIVPPSLSAMNNSERGVIPNRILLSCECEQKQHISKGDQGHDSRLASADGKTESFVNPNLPVVDPQNKMSSPNNTFNVFVNFNPGNIEKTSDPSQIQRSAGKPVANQGAISGISSIASPASQPSEGNRGYATHITLVPSSVIRKMCMLLDLDRAIDGNDYTRLGSELGLDSTQIQTLKQKQKSPSHVLLMEVFPALPNSGTLEHLIPLLKKMGRHDVIQVIDRWVASQKCTQATQV